MRTHSVTARYGLVLNVRVSESTISITRGLDVHGIDLSAAQARELAALLTRLADQAELARP